MSRGSKVVPVRIPDQLFIAVMGEVERINAVTVGEPLNVSSWIRRAIERDLDHSRRSRVKRRSVNGPDPANEKVRWPDKGV